MRDADFVAAIIESVGDGIKHPDEDEPAGNGDVGFADGEALGRKEAAVQERKGEEDVGEGAEGEEAPFVGCGYKGTREVSGDPDPGEGYVVNDCRPGNAREESKGCDEGGPSDEPGVLS